MAGKPIGAALNRDIDVGELSAFIAGRNKKRRKSKATQARAEEDRIIEEAWQESCKRQAAAREAELREQWAAYHQDQAERFKALLPSLVAHHEAEAEKYLSKGP